MKIERAQSIPVFEPVVITIESAAELNLFLHLAGCWTSNSHCAINDEVKNLSEKIYANLISK